jgi:hypothetical protein
MSIRLVNPGNHLPGHGAANKRKSTKAVDRQRISTCKACKLGVYDTDERTWARGQLMGWCHTECVEAETGRAELLAELNRERFGGASC